MKYSILIYGPEGLSDRMSAEDNERLLVRHGELQAALAKRGAFAVARLMPSNSAVTLKPATSPNGQPLIVDGPYSDTKERFLGFYIADFDSVNEATEFARLISAAHMTLEIRPIGWTGGIWSDQERQATEV